jgi:hypothetical protein
MKSEPMPRAPVVMVSMLASADGCATWTAAIPVAEIVSVARSPRSPADEDDVSRELDHKASSIVPRSRTS